MTTTVSAPVHSDDAFGGLLVAATKHKGTLVALIFLLVLLGLVNGLSQFPLGYFDALYLSSGGLALAIAAVGATVVILTGGFDLSVGAVISLVNVVVATQLGDSALSQAGWLVGGVALGAAAGAVNGYFVAVLRLESIIVTLSTMFIIAGITLLLVDRPGGYVPASFSNLLTGSAIDGILPSAGVVVALVMAFWLYLRRTRFGVAIYAIGSDESAARSAGLRTRKYKFGAYVLAGSFYGLAGIVLTAQTATGDPLIGSSLLLQIFTAVVLGGTLLGGGRGGAIGSIIGAYSLMLIVNILLILNVPAYYSTVVEGGVLIAAALLGAWNSSGVRSWTMRMRQTLFSRRPAPATRPLVRIAASDGATRGSAGWLARNRDELRYILPAYLCLGVVLAITAIVLEPPGARYFGSLLLLSSFLVILALGQGTVIISGGLDLSVPWVIGFTGILMGGLASGQNDSLWWALPLVLAIGVGIGVANGIGVAIFKLPAIVVTLAMNGILQGAALLYSDGTPDGFAPPALRWFMNGSMLGLTPVIWFIAGFAVAGSIFLSKSVYGRRIFAVGNSPRVARLSGIDVPIVTIGVYALSGLCAAIVGVLLTGFGGQASLGMGDAYLLPSIAVVIVGGTLITGGRGHYAGMIGGVLLLTSIQMLLSGTTTPNAVREIIYGIVVLVAAATLRERTST